MHGVARNHRGKDSPIKLIDFSLATFFHEPTDPGGTPEFVAPEIVRNPSAIAEDGVGGEVDMWAAGILLYFLLSGRTPFDDKNVQKILQNVMIGRWQWRGKHFDHVSGPAKTLIRKLLTIDPSKRITARPALEDPWVNGSLDLPEEPYLCTIQQPVSSKPSAFKVSGLTISRAFSLFLPPPHRFPSTCISVCVCVYVSVCVVCATSEVYEYAWISVRMCLC
jgi:serine/threonine protein kinase